VATRRERGGHALGERWPRVGREVATRGLGGGHALVGRWGQGAFRVKRRTSPTVLIRSAWVGYHLTVDFTARALIVCAEAP
jgi:hypothetical protein